MKLKAFFEKFDPFDRHLVLRAELTLFGQMSISDHSERCRVDQIHVAAGQFRKCGLRVILGVVT